MQNAGDLVEIAEDLGEDGVRRVLQSVGASAALRAFNRDCAIRYALELLERRLSTAEVRARLIARYNVSVRSAYRLFGEAIKSLPNPPDAGSKSQDDRG